VRVLSQTGNIAGNKSQQAIRWMVNAAISNDPTDLEINELQALYMELRDKNHESEIDQAAMTIVASTIMNMDKALTK
jgi:hypothetical protein